MTASHHHDDYTPARAGSSTHHCIDSAHPSQLGGHAEIPWDTSALHRSSVRRFTHLIAQRLSREIASESRNLELRE